jgi:hypothetical protein
MKTVLIAVSLALAAACGGSGGSSTTDRLANFTGSGWNASVTTTISASCPFFAGQSGTRTYSITFAPTTGADLQWTSAEGCLYKFNVSGNTASLSNPPVTCNTTVNGIPLTATWTSFTATTSDGRNLTIATAGTGTALTQTCPFSETGTATR